MSDTFRLLVRDALRGLKKQPTDLRIDDLNAEFLGTFLNRRPGEHGVQVETRADPKSGRMEGGDALAQRFVLPPRVVGTQQGPPWENRRAAPSAGFQEGVIANIYEIHIINIVNITHN